MLNKAVEHLKDRKYVYVYIIFTVGESSLQIIIIKRKYAEATYVRPWPEL